MKTTPSIICRLVGLNLAALLIALVLGFPNSGQAAGGTWTNLNGGLWNVAGNWDPNAVPGTAAGDIVNLTTNLAAAKSITNDTTVTLGTLTIGDRTTAFFAYTLTNNAANTFTFNNGGSQAFLYQTNGTTALDIIATPLVLADNLTVSNNGTGGLLLSGIISGASKGITKTGTGLLTFNNANTFSGGMTISNGAVLIKSNTAFGTGLLTLGGGTLTNGANITVTNDINLSGTTTMGVSNAVTLTLSGVITNAGGLTKSGTGTNVLSGANTYTGTTTISAGTLTLSGARTAASGQISANNGTLNIQNGTYSLGSSTFFVGVGGNATVNQSAGDLSFTSGQGLLLGNGTQSGFTSTYNLSGGTFTNFASATRGVLMGVNSATSGNNQTVIFNLSGTGALNLGTAAINIGRSDAAARFVNATFSQTGGTATVGTLTLGGMATTANSSSNINSTLSLTGGTFTNSSFTLLAAGTNNTAAITIGGTADVTLPAFPAVRGENSTATITFDGGTLRPYAASATYLTNFVTASLTANGANFNVASGKDITVGQVLANAPAQVGKLTKAGAGTLTLLGANTYTGNSLVSGGKLVVSSAQSGGGTFTVNDATSLGVVRDGTVTSLVASGLTLGSSTGAKVEFTFPAGNPAAEVITASTLTLNGAIAIKVNGVFTVGQFPLIKYTTLVGLESSLTNGTPQLPSGVVGSIVHNPGNSSFDLNITSLTGGPVAALTWAGTASSTWDNLISANWTNNSGSVVFNQGDTVTLDDTASGSTSVTLSGTLQPSAVTVSNDAKSYTLSGPAGILTGTMSLTKSGTNTLNISSSTSTHTFTGGLTIKAGKVVATGTANNLGTGALTLGDTSGAADVTMIVGAATWTNAVNVVSGSSGTLSLANNGSTVSSGFSGPVSLNNNLTISATGTTGSTTVSGGVTGAGNLTLNDNATTTGTITLGAGAINPTGSITNSGTGTGVVTISGPIGENVTRVVQNSATSPLYFSGSNTFSGGVTILQGLVRGVTTNNAFGTGTITIGDTTGSANATLQGSYTGTYTNPIVVASGNTGVATITNSAANTFSGGITLTSHDLTLASLNSSFTFSGGITGTGNLTVNAAGTGSLTNVTADVNNAGTIINSGTGAGTAVFNCAIGANVTGVTQNSATSKLILSGANTYTGPTTVSAGTLQVNGSLASGSAVTVQTGGTLEGVGTVAGTVTVNSGGTITAGAGGVGTLTLTDAGGLSLASGSIANFEFAADGSSNDKIDASSGALTINSGDVINLYAVGTANPFAGVGTFNLIKHNGTVNGGPATLTVANAQAGWSYVFDNDGTWLRVTIGETNNSDTWGVDAAGTWITAGNWLGGKVPGISGGYNSTNVATFSLALSANRTITVDANRNIGGMVFSAPNVSASSNYTVSGGSLKLSSGGNLLFTRQKVDTSDTIASAITIQGDGGSASFTANNVNQSSVAISGAVTGVSTTGNTTTLTLNGTGVSATPARSQNGIAGVIGDGTAGGNLAIVKSGAGVWTLTGNNTFSGGVMLNQGTLRYFGGVANAFFGTGTLTLADGVTLSHANTGTNNITNPITVNGNFTYSGSDNTTLSGPINFGAATRQITVGNSQSILGVISGGAGAGLTKAGGGTLTLFGQNTYSGDTTISGGTVNLGAVDTIPAGSGKGNVVLVNALTNILNLNGFSPAINGLSGAGVITNGIAGTPTLTVGSNDQTSAFSGSITTGTGDVALTKVGTGTLTLSGANTYTGSTTVSNGTLLVSGSINSVSTAVKTGATLGGGTVNGSVSVEAGGSLTMGNNAVGQLTITNNLNLTDSTLVYDLTNNINGDKIVVGGNLTPTGVTTINLGTSPGLANGDYTLIEVTGTLDCSATNLAGVATNFTTASPVGPRTQTITYLAGTPNKVLLHVTGGPENLVWQGDGGANQWDINTTSNWLAGVSSSKFNNDDTVTFNDNGGLNATVDITTSVVPTDTIVNSASNYTFTGAGGIGGTGGLTKSGAGTLTVATANGFSGAVNVSAGTLVAANSTALGTTAGGVVVGVGGTLSLTNDITIGAETLSLTGGASDSVLRNVGGTNVWGGNITADTGNSSGRARIISDAGRLLITGNIVTSGNQDFTIGGVGDGEISGNISGTRTLFKSSSSTGAWTISGNNTYALSTTVSRGIMFYAGTLTNNAGITVANDAKLVVSGAISSGTGALQVGVATATAGSITLNSGADVVVNNVEIGSVANGNGAVNITGGSLRTTGASGQTSFRFGNAGYGSFMQSGGTVTTPYFNVGWGGICVALITNGTFNCTTQYVLIAQNGTGVVTVATGGTLNHNYANLNGINIGNSAANSCGQLNLTGGTIDNTLSSVSIGNGGAGYVNLNAGLLKTDYFTRGTGLGSARLNLNGATIQASSNTTVFLPGNIPTYVNGAFGSYAGGAVVDAAGDNTIGAALQAPTGDGVSDIVVATEGSGYIGAPYVSITGGGTNATAIAEMADDGIGGLKVVAIRITNPGINYSTLPTVTLYGGGSTNPATIGTVTTAANTSGGLIKLGAGILTLTGTNTYTGNTVVSNGTLRLHATNFTALVTVKSNATVGGNGYLRSVAVEDGGLLSPGASVGKLSLTNLTLAATATNVFEFDVAGNTNDIVDVLDLTAGGSVVQVNITGGTLAAGSYRLFNYGVKSGSFNTNVVLASGSAAGGLFLQESVSGQVNLVVNVAPVANPATYTRTSGLTLKISITNLLSTYTSDVNGDTRTLASVSTTTNGATLTTDANYIYVPANNVDDAFDYVVTDGFGNYATNTVTVQVVTPAPGFNLLSPLGTISNGVVELSYVGVANTNYKYALDWATNLNEPVDWVAVITNHAQTNGLVLFTNDNGSSLQNYFRTRYVP